MVFVPAALPVIAVAALNVSELPFELPTSTSELMLVVDALPKLMAPW